MANTATETAGFASQTGVVYGWTKPSITKGEVVGHPGTDLAYNVRFEEHDIDAWFAPHLVERVE